MKVSGYDGAAAASAIPTPARPTPAGRSQSAPRTSDQSPNSGWISDELIVAARTSAEAIV